MATPKDEQEIYEMRQAFAEFDMTVNVETANKGKYNEQRLWVVRDKEGKRMYANRYTNLVTLWLEGYAQCYDYNGLGLRNVTR